MDFRSALYLGMRHGARDGWAAWASLTLGKPAALQEPPGAAALAQELAALQGCEAATLLPSTLHLYRDVFGLLAQGVFVQRPALLVDVAAYPIARWGVEWAAAQGMPVRRFRHGDLRQLCWLAQRAHRQGCAPVVLADGYTPGDPWPPPLRAYADIVMPLDGWLVLDDTQALGVLGQDGGGSVRLHGLQGARVLAGASLAKGFGAPLAVLAGPAPAIAAFEQRSESRVHASPPSVAVIAAARHALRVNARDGPSLRRTLLARIRQLRQALAALGLACHGGGFPVQLVPLPPMSSGDAAALAEQVQGVLLRTKSGLALALLLRADHREADVTRVAALLANGIARCGGGHGNRIRDIAVFS
ncbi:aminotransferase class I/II-fold pyridoxal phosphate-dependent enzyme [Pseudoduganella ginsengisoli]|uniref:Aminotransferase class I/II-fold pyridoxal phosphate-dependent enzyme n=1 Tax=Pseudoduganella ginsengisoli TaxID=1462440 RepID=A0A6L6Q050_9BURK|nr:aminotransferase class I/II-fold pyridoxal phosphate-dependent enzyme [Pseudoduganella ginsengisoli]